MRRSRSYIAIPPGATIKEQLVDRGMSQGELAERMGVPERHIAHLLSGDVRLSAEDAQKLERVMGIPTDFWIRLEEIYREKLAKIAAENAFDQD